MDKHEYESLALAMADLTEDGYTETFRTIDDVIEGVYTKKKFKPGQLIIDKAYRFANQTDPGDESELFAVSAKDGTKGTMVISFSAKSDANRQLIKEIKTKE